ncbi:hypothetical protein P9E03_04690 [Bacillus mojavensis]|uniref:hypothetical protein n=1 Tax=Bacillus mojavensis TaxID=72360 RepID=UPI00227E8F82|nr:hypothetical protein [Bacillus mojavensis]MCY9092996.1 hypothetical protein [Bacillus mojavensis]MEC1798399.1 hypothetical protein [Bacillus mojavensis]
MGKVNKEGQTFWLLKDNSENISSHRLIIKNELLTNTKKLDEIRKPFTGKEITLPWLNKETVAGNFLQFFMEELEEAKENWDEDED